MRATVGRGEALRLLKIEHQAAADLINALTDDEMTRPDTIQHGLYYDQECSFKDLLAHLICYEVYTAEAIGDWQQGQKHWVIEAVQDPRKSREIHYGGIAERAHCGLAQQVDEYERVSNQLEAVLAKLSDADWRGAAPLDAGEATDLGGMIESIMVTPPRPMYRHLPVHVPDATAYLHSLR